MNRITWIIGLLGFLFSAVMIAVPPFPGCRRPSRSGWPRISP